MNNDWVQDDFYALLGINQLASNDEINKAYRLKAKQTHPDVYQVGSIQYKKAEENFKKLTIAKDTLLDPVKRKEHDNQLLLNQQLYISYMANTYSTIPLRKETPSTKPQKEEEEEKPSFMDILKNKMESGTNKKYVYSEKYKAYVSPEALKKERYQEEDEDEDEKEEYIFDDVMTPQEKSDMYKKEKAKHLYDLAVKALGYGDKYRAQVYFKSAKFLDPTIKIPLGIYYNK